MADSIFDGLNINDPQETFQNAIKKGMKNPEDYMYMHSTRFKDYFKHRRTRTYVSYFHFKNLFK